MMEADGRASVFTGDQIMPWSTYYVGFSNHI